MKNMHYFAFFGLPVSFHPDETELKRRFYENSKKYHPDFHTLADDAHRADMLELSTVNNEAYKTLADPDRRMRYVLELYGLLGEEMTAQAVPQDFLLDMMDINENLAELEFDFDPERYQATKAAVDALERDLNAEIQPLLERWKPDDAPALEIVRNFYLKKRYLLRIRENLSKFAAP